MKINEIITEFEVKPYEFKKLQLKTAVRLLNKHCSEALGLLQNPIWRGMRNHTEEILRLDPTTGERASHNTSNHYTQLIDNSPYFRGWPKRSHSLICSSNLGRASSYSYGQIKSVYAIFPYNGVKIAVCPGEDIWETNLSIPELNKDFDRLRQLNNFLR